MDKTTRWLLKVLFFTSLLFPLLGQSEVPLKYQIQPGEDIGTVLVRLGLEPVWTKNGSFKKTVQANLHLKERYSRFNLPPYTWINLPVSTLPKSDSYNINIGILEFSKKNKKFQATDIKKVMSFVNNQNLKGNYQNLRDIVIHYHGDSKTKDKDHPIVVNLNFYNYSGDNNRKLASTNIKGSTENSFWPKLESQSLSLTTGTHSLKIDGIENTGRRAKILSDSGLSVTLDWQQKWTDRYSSALSLQTTKYEISNNSGTSLISGDNNVLLSYWIRNNYRLLNRLNAYLNIGNVNKYFINSSSGNILLSDENILSSSTGIHYQFLKWSNHTFSAALGFQYNLGKSTSYAQIDSGIGYETNLNYNYNIQGHQLGAGLDYNQLNQNTDQFTQDDTELILSILYRYTFGESDQ